MRGNELLDCMELVDTAYVEAADAPVKKKTWLRWAAMAAGLCLVAGTVFAFVRTPGVKQDSDPDIAYYSLDDLKSRRDFASIIWGGETSAGTDADGAPGISGGSDCSGEKELTEWNGITMSASLQSVLMQAKADDLISVGVDCWAEPALLYDDYVELEDYVHADSGKTYGELSREYAAAEQLQLDLDNLKKFSSIYIELDGKGYDAFWNDLHSVVEDEMIVRYFRGDKANGQFDTATISEDLNSTTAEQNRLQNAMADCRRAHKNRFPVAVDLSKLMNKGYYVTGNGKCYAVILPAGQMMQFCEDVKELFDAKILQSTSLRLASKSELGLEIYPVDDSVDEMPEQPAAPDDVAIHSE